MSHPTGDALNDGRLAMKNALFAVLEERLPAEVMVVLAGAPFDELFDVYAAGIDAAILKTRDKLLPKAGSAAVRDVNRECAEFDRSLQEIAHDICPRCNGFKKVTVRSPDLDRDNPFFDRIVSVPCPDCAATGWRKP